MSSTTCRGNSKFQLRAAPFGALTRKLTTLALRRSDESELAARRLGIRFVSVAGYPPIRILRYDSMLLFDRIKPWKCFAASPRFSASRTRCAKVANGQGLNIFSHNRAGRPIVF